jgi:hypothetical protein
VFSLTGDYILVVAVLQTLRIGLGSSFADMQVSHMYLLAFCILKIQTNLTFLDSGVVRLFGAAARGSILTLFWPWHNFHIYISIVKY